MQKLILTLGIAAMITACGGTGGGKADSHDHGDGGHAGHDHGSEQMDKKGPPAFSPAPENARVFFKNIKDGDELTLPFYAEFGVEGMTVSPAGEVKEGTGHHHIIIDAEKVGEKEIVPARKNMYIHYGGGQLGDTLKPEQMAPGKHKLALQFADGIHRSYGEQMYHEVEVTVVAAE